MIKYLESLVLVTASVFAPIKAAIIVAMALIMADLVFGLIAAKKRGEKLSSSGLRRTVTKVFVYEVAIMLGFLTETYMIGQAIPLVKLISGLIGIVELKSVLESLDELNGSSLFSSVIQKLGSKNDV